jgi:Tfp pilus assembly protein PilF
MGRPKNEQLTKNLARHLCQRLGNKAVLAGSISSLGAHYVIGLNAFDCRTGDGLASQQVEADSREHVLRALGDAATGMRRKLGESLSTIQKYGVPPEQVTTSSLESLRAYTLGEKTWRLNSEASGLSFFKRAAELDPDFAMAYAKMGVIYFGLGNSTLTVENMRRAYALRARVSEQERRYLESHYYEFATGELEKAAEAYELWRQMYPREPGPSDNLVLIYAMLGNPGKACESALDAMRVEPNNVESYNDLAFCHISFNRVSEAETVLKEAEARRLGEDFLAWDRYQVAFLKSDHEQMKRLATEHHTLNDLLALTAAYHGKLAAARALWRTAESEPQGAGFAGEGTLYTGLTEAILGDSQNARRELAKLNANADLQAEGTAGLALALIGDSVRAERLASDVMKKWPVHTLSHRYWLPIIGAVLALNRKDASAAIGWLRPVSPYDLSAGAWPYPVYLRGQAYLMLHDPGAAIGEFQKILDRPGLTLEGPVGALAHLGLARAYALQGDTAKARTAYQDFLTLWKDADPDIPILQQAKAEHAKLK